MLSPHPKLLLISFDGFRYDLLNGTMTPNIYRWAINSTWFKNGSKSQFVTYTAPNHMSIVTGLQEVKHGIVGNYFYDTTTGKLFDYFNLTGKEGVINASLDSSWYEGEPVWLTNEKSDSSRRSATFYWPHGDVHFRTSPHRPFFYKQWTTYGNLSQWMSDVDDIVDAFMSEEHPVNYVAWYVAEPDHTLHTNGFYNGELQKMLHELDELFGYLLAKFRETSLENSIESVNNVMCIRDYVKLDSSKIGDHMIYADNEEIARELYHNLTNAVKTFGYKVDVYMKEDVPARYYYSNSTRIGDVVIVPQVGWAASLTCTSKELSETYAPRKARYNSSTHGMDPDRKEMRAVLVVGGPSIMSGRKACLLVFLEYHDSGTFMFLVMTTSFILMVFVIYACRYSILTEQPVWVWGQKGYRPLKTDLCSAEQSMSLLPKTTDEFTDPKFWKHFFETRKAPFEWYGDYSILGSVLEKYLRLGDTVLQIGCGNSRLAEEMYDNGFRSIHSIDVDSAVIEEQRLRNRKRPELLYAKDDATSLSFGDDLFSVVVDKGTLDSLLPPHATAQQTESVRKMFQEVERVLKEGKLLFVFYHSDQIYPNIILQWDVIWL
uniref:Bis(5'-adenosyl)-triphosphatase n=1 Tax=Angiostrongylus cantonensis TaxID=6313 RepID=A0A0K0DIE8_ANGCA